MRVFGDFAKREQEARTLGAATPRFVSARCYVERFGAEGFVNADIHATLEAAARGELLVPEVDMVVGGFPCQDYSVARTLSQAEGIEGKKGVLWWDIVTFLQLRHPRWCLFENVDRLLKSPASQRGRDFAIILSCLDGLGYSVEWRVVNSAEYGFPQRRKRTYILAERDAGAWDLAARIEGGLMARALPIAPVVVADEFDLESDTLACSERFGRGLKVSPFKAAGAMQGRHVATADVTGAYDGPRMTLGDVLVPEGRVPAEYYVPDEQLPQWAYLKGAKSLERTSRSGHSYRYSEGAMAYPDPLDRPSRTILTGEGGRTPSRFKHIIRCADGRCRRLVPDELDRLQGFPAGWTATGMTDVQRAFCMGNALVVGVPHRIGVALAEEVAGRG